MDISVHFAIYEWIKLYSEKNCYKPFLYFFFVNTLTIYVCLIIVLLLNAGFLRFCAFGWLSGSCNLLPANHGGGLPVCPWCSDNKSLGQFCRFLATIVRIRLIWFIQIVVVFCYPNPTPASSKLDDSVLLKFMSHTGVGIIADDWCVCVILTQPVSWQC